MGSTTRMGDICDTFVVIRKRNFCEGTLRKIINTVRIFDNTKIIKYLLIIRTEIRKFLWICIDSRSRRPDGEQKSKCDEIGDQVSSRRHDLPQIRLNW